VNGETPQLRSGMRLRGMLGAVGIALIPCALVGLWNTGHQANLWLAANAPEAPGWRVEVLRALGIPIAPESLWASLAHGLLWMAPLFAVSLAAGWTWETLFTRVRGRPRDAALYVIVSVFVLSLPAAVPLWQVALGSSFAIVFGKELFGGTGRNVVNPAVAGLAFLYLAYPETASGDRIWIPVDGASGATPLAAARQGVEALRASGLGWLDAFLGRKPGALGETSAAACALGALWLVYLRLADWRILAGGLGGLAATSLAFQGFAADAPSMAQLPWYWHATLGSFAFGLAFLATDPVTSAATPGGRLAYGLLIGFLVVVIRVANPAHREGMIFAVLLANLTAPLLDHAVIRVRAWRRRLRDGRI
jgi:Na+-transporting NADH:ubiquinone oxidoreductase subunit B